MDDVTVAVERARYGPQALPTAPPTHAQAVEYCRRLAVSHYENFTVASWFLPRRLREHFYAVYAYCRWSDDLADEAASPAESLQLLDWWQGELEKCYQGQAVHPVFVALRGTIDAFAIPIEPFADLLTAFRQDQRQTRYATHDDVLAYCRYSANPVGRLILYLGRAHDETRGALADAICTGLQLANFAQDVARDWRKGRVYLPQETLAACGYEESMLARGECNAAFRRAMAIEVERAEGYFRRGDPLAPLMPRELRLDVALFAAGGRGILAAIRQQNFNVLARRPTVSRAAKLQLLARCWWQTGPGHGQGVRP